MSDARKPVYKTKGVDNVWPPLDTLRLFNSNVSFVCLRLGGEVTDELGCDCVVDAEWLGAVVVDVGKLVVDEVVVLGTSDPLLK